MISENHEKMFQSGKCEIDPQIVNERIRQLRNEKRTNSCITYSSIVVCLAALIVILLILTVSKNINNDSAVGLSFISSALIFYLGTSIDSIYKSREINEVIYNVGIEIYESGNMDQDNLNYFRKNILKKNTTHFISKNDIDSSSSKDKKTDDNFKNHLDNCYFLMNNIYLRKFKRILLIISLLSCCLLYYFLVVYTDDIIIICENTFLNNIPYFKSILFFKNGILIPLILAVVCVVIYIRIKAKNTKKVTEFINEYEEYVLNKVDMNNYQDLYSFYNLLLKDVKSMKILNRRNYPFIKK